MSKKKGNKIFLQKLCLLQLWLSGRANDLENNKFLKTDFFIIDVVKAWITQQHNYFRLWIFYRCIFWSFKDCFTFDISTKGVVINTFGQSPNIRNIFLLPNINSVCITQSCKPDGDFFLLHPYCWHHARSPIPQYNYWKRRHYKLLFLDSHLPWFAICLDLPLLRS